MARIGEYKRFEKEVPFTVVDSVKGATDLFNARIKAKAASKRAETRERTIQAWAQVQANRETLKMDLVKVKLGLEPSELYKRLSPKKIEQPKPTILSRIYNWFLNIKY